MKFRDLIKFDIDPVEIESYLDKLKNQESIVTIAGEFSSGKSTFLNALIGKKRFLPEALTECTPVLLDLFKSNSNLMGIVYQDGSIDEIELLEGYIEKYAKYTKEYDESIRMITIPVDSAFLPKNVHFVDTPGSNTTIDKHEEIANYVIRKSDVVLYVVNKSISETDFNRLQYIKKYTEDIMIIISHIDEGSNGGDYLPQETIDRLVEEARINLKDRLELDEIEILPVGSIQALQDDTYIKPIRECVHAYIEENTSGVMKKRVQQQLSQVFAKKLSQFKQHVDLLMIGLTSEQEEMIEKVEIFEKKITRLEENKKVRVKRLAEMAEEQKEILGKELQILIDEYKAQTVSELINGDVTQKDVANVLTKANEAICHELVKKTEHKINYLLEMSYQEMNHELEDLIKGLNIDVDIEITPPKLDELDFEVDESKVVRLHKAKDNYEKYLKELEHEIAAANEENQALIEQRNLYQGQLQEVAKQMWSLGSYQPEFNEVVVTGGRSTGAQFGRVLGEIADIALIFYNPAGGGAAVADVAKDAAKIGSLMNKAAQGKKAADQVKKAKEVADTAIKTKKIADKLRKGKVAVDKVIVKRKEALEELEEYRKELPEEKQKSVLDLLDYLSLGFWGEKIGGGIGESVKPTKVVYEENESKKQAWELERDSIRQGMKELEMSINCIERDLSQARSITEKRRLKLQIEEKIKRQDQLIEEKQHHADKLKNFNMQKEVENYYQNQVNQFFDTELIQIQKEVGATMNYSLEAIAKNYESEFDREINKLKEMVSDLQKSKADLEIEVKRNQELVEELSDYPVWIEEWVVANGDH